MNLTTEQLQALADRFRNIGVHYSEGNGGWHVEALDFVNNTDVSGPARETRLAAVLALVDALPEGVA